MWIIYDDIVGKWTIYFKKLQVLPMDQCDKNKDFSKHFFELGVAKN